MNILAFGCLINPRSVHTNRNRDQPSLYYQVRKLRPRKWNDSPKVTQRGRDQVLLGPQDGFADHPASLHQMSKGILTELAKSWARQGPAGCKGAALPPQMIK